jgi:2,3-dihydroxybiphenyl 1,2-dioxygenase
MGRAGGGREREEGSTERVARRRHLVNKIVDNPASGPLQSTTRTLRAWRPERGAQGNPAMTLQSLGYIGVHTDNLDDWADYATGLLGMQLVEKTRASLTFRMDDRKQRVVVERRDGETQHRFGWEVEGAAALDALGARLEAAGVAVAHGSAALAAQRRVKDLIVFADPAGNRLEAFHGAEIADEPFRPARNISGFRTGPLGVGHAVLTVERIDDVMPFYTDVLGFRLSDYVLSPFKVFFFHINARHHSLALLEWGKNGIHHLMVENLSLDDLGQGYDIALLKPERVATTLGRHVNDHVLSFYTFCPSGFMVECGWGGATIDVDTWQPHEETDGPSLWGHERSWLPPEGRARALDMRLDVARRGVRHPIEVMPGNHTVAADECPWFARAKRREAGVAR